MMERRERYRGPPRRRSYRSGPRKKKQFIKKFREVAILDLLIHGHPEEDKPSWAKTPIAQVLTFPDFVLYEVKVNKNSDIGVQEQKTYEEFLNEEKLKEVLKKIDYNDLTSTSKALIQPILEKEVLKYEEEFINFFNNSTSITPRMHALKLLPGVGQKHMWEILEARQRQKFGTFQDISDRTSISNPTKLIAQRIIKELQRDVKYYLFSKTRKYE
ncbi:MAG: DNA-binding protein [Promethearchaeota archaeon Loki_b32]|nr:MAG: DNA-binding protein [Candidatus Lokiarchaeota archaeon Loki_b32]